MDTRIIRLTAVPAHGEDQVTLQLERLFSKAVFDLRGPLRSPTRSSNLDGQRKLKHTLSQATQAF